MNILEICINNSLGGLELYFTRCAKYFTQSKNHHCIAVISNRSPLEKLLTEAGVKIFHLEKKNNYYPILASRKIAILIEQQNIDIVHVHHKYDIALAVFARVFCKKKFKIIHTRQMELPHKKVNPYHKKIYQQIDVFIAITEELKRDAEKNLSFIKDKIIKLYYGVDKVEPNLERIKQFLIKFPTNDFKIAMFSRIGNQKGHHRLINAIAILKSEGIKVQAYIFGHSMNDGYQETLLELINKLNLSDQVYWCGFQPKPSELMTAFDVILLPSNKETFGLVLAEAMQSGVSVIGSNTGGVPEIITEGKTGYMFTPENYSELAAKIKLMIDEPEKKKAMIKEALVYAQNNFNTQKHFEKLEEIFLKCLENSTDS